MAPPPRRPRPLPNDTTEPSLPAHEPNGPADTDELPPHLPARRSDLPARRGSRPPVRRGAVPEAKKRSPLIPVLLLAVLAVGGAIAWKKLSAGDAPPPPPQGLEAARIAFQEGKNLVRKGQWKLAQQQFDQAAKLAPDLDGLKPYLDAEKSEVPLQEHLDAAEKALEQKQLGPASKELAAVPDTSVQAPRRTELQQRLAKVMAERLKEARLLADDPAKMRELLALAEDVLVAFPENRDALSFKELATRALAPKAAPPPPPPGDPSREIIALWAGGDSSAAFAKADACSAANQRCAKLKEQITKAMALFKKLETLEEAELLELVRLDKEIGGGAQSPSGKQAGIRLGALLTPKMSNPQKHWGQAMAIARKILEGDPNNAVAKKVIEDGEAAGDEKFHQCYIAMQSTPEDAVPLCREVVEMFPEKHPLRVKAEALIKSRGK